MILYVDCAYLNDIMDVAQTIPPDPTTGEEFEKVVCDWQLMKKM